MNNRLPGDFEDSDGLAVPILVGKYIISSSSSSLALPILRSVI